MNKRNDYDLKNSFCHHYTATKVTIYRFLVQFSSWIRSEFYITTTKAATYMDTTVINQCDTRQRYRGVKQGRIWVSLRETESP